SVAALSVSLDSVRVERREHAQTMVDRRGLALHGRGGFAGPQVDLSGAQRVYPAGPSLDAEPEVGNVFFDGTPSNIIEGDAASVGVQPGEEVG
ncbi:MAG: hypothetical protein M3P70_14250, partial [Actinomycetota bacterium]|nr:hypothetical protein [Actinomycetota bacterium]